MLPASIYLAVFACDDFLQKPTAGSGGVAPYLLSPSTIVFKVDFYNGSVYIVDGLPSSPIDSANSPSHYTLQMYAFNNVPSLLPPAAFNNFTLTVDIGVVNFPVVFNPPSGVGYAPYHASPGTVVFTVPSAALREPSPPFIVNCTFTIASGNDDGTFRLVTTSNSFTVVVSANAGAGSLVEVLL